ncbi:hypothetical protein Tco_1501348 [Tanacetum coccineum]
MATKPKLDVDLSGKLIDQTDYRSKIGSLMYLTSSRPDIVQEYCYCARRYQARQTEKYLKRGYEIFRYLRGTINMGLWYSKDSGFELTAFSDADHAGCIDTRKSTSGGIYNSGDKLSVGCQRSRDCTECHQPRESTLRYLLSCAQVIVDGGHNLRFMASTTKQIPIVLRLSVSHSNLMQPYATLPYQAHQYSILLYQGIGLLYLVRRIGMRCLTPVELEVLANEFA